MKTTKFALITIFFVMFVLAVAIPARAESPIDECKDRVDLIQTDLVDIFIAEGIGGNNSQQTFESLTSKLQGAKTKLDAHKFVEARQKLEDIKTAVIAMSDAAKPKLSEVDADLLLDGNEDDPYHPLIDEGVNGAILCVSLLP